MESISQKDIELIEKLCLWDIEQFEGKTSFKANYQQLRKLLYYVKDYSDEEGYNQYFHSILWELPQKISEVGYKELYKEFLLDNFHNEHEEIVSAFQITYNNDIENIPILLKSIENIPEYLQKEDFKYSYIRKIIYAIGAQPQPESLLALEKLVSETNDKKIKELALHQIEKRKELGRWEF